MNLFRSIIFSMALLGMSLPIAAQPVNDQCETATVIEIVTDSQAVCIQGTTLNALPEPFNNSCEIGTWPTVWFRIVMDNNPTILNILVTSEEFDTPALSLFQGLPDCSNMIPIALTQSSFECIVGFDGEAEAIGTSVGANTVYYLAVNSINSGGGIFELCISAIAEAGICVTDRNIEIVSRSSGGPLSGPFLPGETIGVCMNVNEFSTIVNGCQWFQGLVPVFGNGWDPASFDVNGQPFNATINGLPMGQEGNGLYGNSTWDWFDDVGYHHDNVFLQVGDIDGNGTVDMCNILYSLNGVDCPDFGGITGGCCGPCWNSPPNFAGDILPPGWFAYGTDGVCNLPGPPIAYDWGDGSSCNSIQGPWSFCFELITRSFPDCAEDETTSDLSLAFFTFADGETGSWTGAASNCAYDIPAQLTLDLCCTNVEQSNIELNGICTGGIVVYELNQPGIEFWEWDVQSSNVNGGNDGQGGSVAFIQDTLINPGIDQGHLIYRIKGYEDPGCPAVQVYLSIDVYAELSASISPMVLCTIPGVPNTLTTITEGGSGDFTFQWLPGGETTPVISIDDPDDNSTYSVTVTDLAGCTATSELAIDVYPGVQVAINASVTEQCLQDGPLEILALATGESSPFDFIWNLPDGSQASGEILTTALSGDHIIEVTDTNGCSALDTVTLAFFEAPVASISDSGLLSICSGDTAILNATIDIGEPPYLITWQTPSGIQTSGSIEAYFPGIYILSVEDVHECRSLPDTIQLELTQLPVVDIGPDSILVNGSATLDAGNAGLSYLWNTGDTTQTIVVTTTGNYSVAVTDDNGCVAVDTIFVDVITDVIQLSDNNELRIFPNPNNGVFQIEAELSTLELFGIKMTDATGRIVYRSVPTRMRGKVSVEVKLDRTGPGVYFIQIDIGKRKYWGKVVIEY